MAHVICTFEGCSNTVEQPDTPRRGRPPKPFCSPYHKAEHERVRKAANKRAQRQRNAEAGISEERTPEPILLSTPISEDGTPLGTLLAPYAVDWHSLGDYTDPGLMDTGLRSDRRDKIAAIAQQDDSPEEAKVARLMLANTSKAERRHFDRQADATYVPTASDQREREAIFVDELERLLSSIVRQKDYPSHLSHRAMDMLCDRNPGVALQIALRMPRRHRRYIQRRVEMNRLGQSLFR